MPRLTPDTALPDQLRVIVADLIAAERDGPALAAAAKRVRRAL